MDDQWTSVFLRVKYALRKLGRSEHDADDLVQEAYVRLVSYSASNVVRNPAAFLMRAALNLAKDASRSRARHGTEVLLEDVAVADTAPALEDAILSRERLRRLLECINQLPEKTRLVFLAHRIDGMSYQ